MRYTIKTSGLMCGHCDATVETALLNVAGVTDADADHETQTVQVECADTVTAEQLAAAMLPVIMLTAVFNAILVAALYVPIKKALKLS